MGIPSTTTVITGAWVGQCPSCQTCYLLPGFHAFDYAGQPVARPERFDEQPITCFCGSTFRVNTNSLMFVTIAGLSIRRLSPGTFAVEKNCAGATTDLGPMSEVQLEAFLRLHSLVGLTPQQLFYGLTEHGAVNTNMVDSVVRNTAEAELRAYVSDYVDAKWQDPVAGQISSQTADGNLVCMTNQGINLWQQGHLVLSCTHDAETRAWYERLLQRRR